MAEEDIYRETPESEPEPEPPTPPPPEEKGETIFKREEKGISDEEKVPVKKEVTPEEAAPPEEKKLPPYFKRKEVERWLRTDPKAYDISRMSREKRVKIPDKMETILKRYRANVGGIHTYKPREIEKTLKVLKYEEQYKKTKEGGRWRPLGPNEVKEARQTRKLLEGFLEDQKPKK